MAGKVKLRDLVDAFNMHFDEIAQFVDRDKGEVVAIDRGELSAAEEEEEDDSEEVEIADEMALAREIAEGYGTRFIRLPEQDDLNQYGIMEEFCESVDNERLRNELLQVIRGRGAFGRFKDKITERGISDQWYAFQSAALREKAIEWCKDNRISYED